METKIEQLSIFIENRSGRLARITSLLGEAGVNIRAMSLADTSDFGILRLIVDNPELARYTLRDQGFTVNRTDVVAVEIPDHPGSLGRLLSILERAALNVEYMYAFVQKGMDHAVVVFRFENLDHAVRTMTAEGITVLDRKKVYSL
jgi:hypothetical protein